MDKSVIDAFWRKRAAEGKGRWTEQTLFDYEFGWLARLLEPTANILDLGSGPGELSSRLLSPAGHLTLVDKYPDFLRLAPNERNIRRVCCDVLDYVSQDRFDLILIFGVVTHLTQDEEACIYRKAAELISQQGILVVKNQVSVGAEKIVSGYSTGLQQNYCGRYPGLAEQQTRLANVFNNVELVRYPDHFNPWPDTRHVAFICKEAI